MVLDERSTGTRRQFLAGTGTATAAGLAGCLAETPERTPRPEEATVTVRLRNDDGVEREFEVVVEQGESLRDEFSGVLPPDMEEAVELVATFRATDEQHQFSIATQAGQRGRTWDPRECGDFLVDAAIEGGEPTFETRCRSE